MKKIVILGCENTHAGAFLGLIKEKERYADVEVVGVYSHEPDAAKDLSERFGVPVMENFDDAVGKVDGVIITARHGDNHYKYAKPYIASGVPMFIDKPITVSEDEAVELMRECREHGVRVTGGSSVIHSEVVKMLSREREENVGDDTLGGFVRCPIMIDNPNGGYFFYAEHLVGVVSHIFGFYPESVMAYKNDNKITIVFRYEHYDVVGLNVDNNEALKYYAMRVSTHGTRGEEILVTPSCFRAEFEEFYRLLCGEEQAIRSEDFIAPVFVMNAINRSLESGKEEMVKGFKI